MYFVTLVAEAETEVRLVPLRIRRFRLWRASESDAEWLQRRLDRESRRFGTRVEQATDGSFEVRAA